MWEDVDTRRTVANRPSPLQSVPRRTFLQPTLLERLETVEELELRTELSQEE